MAPNDHHDCCGKFPIVSVPSPAVQILLSSEASFAIENKTTEDFTTKNLKDIIEKAAQKIFQDTYGFSYQASNTSLPIASEPAYIQHADVFTVIDTGNTTKVKACFTDTLSTENVPSWAIGKSVSQIVTTAGSIFKDSKLNQWKHGVLKGSYDDPSGGSASHEIRAVYVYANANVGKGASTDHTIVYYLGVAWGEQK